MIAPLAMLLAATALPLADNAGKCDLPTIASIAEVDKMLSRRAVEAINRARHRGWATDTTLAAIVEESAEFNLGIGDVGGPMGKGIEGLRAMAITFPADSFRFSQWSGAPPPDVNPCAEWKVDVEFVDGLSSRTSTIKFSFRNGRIIGASGWEGSFLSGKIDGIER